MVDGVDPSTRLAEAIQAAAEALRAHERAAWKATGRDLPPDDHYADYTRQIAEICVAASAPLIRRAALNEAADKLTERLTHSGNSSPPFQDGLIHARNVVLALASLPPADRKTQ